MAALDYVNKGGKIEDIADQMDKLCDAHLKKHSEKVQRKIVENVLFPLGRRLMRENPVEYSKVLEIESNNVNK